MTRLTKREEAILRTMRDSGDQRADIGELQMRLRWEGSGDVPPTTIRRTIGDLRRKGYDIRATLPNSRLNNYLLVSEPTPQATPTPETTDASL